MPQIWENEGDIYAKGHLSREELAALYKIKFGDELPKGTLEHEWYFWVPGRDEYTGGEMIGYPAQPHAKGAGPFTTLLPRI